MRKTFRIILLPVALLLAACSTTSNLTDDETLYAGITDMHFTDTAIAPKYLSHYETVQSEVEAALDCPPNGAFFGSSSIVNPMNIRLRIYNKYLNSTTGFGKWMRNSFGAEPVLIDNVNPEVRSLVAKNVLRSNGYFNAAVDYDIIPQKNPKKAKIGYTVSAGPLYVIDTLKYVGFPAYMDSLIRTDDNVELKIYRGSPFSLAQLDNERVRISNFLRNRGYYYYNADYSTFLADSVSNPGSVEVRLQPVADIPERATRQWYMGKLHINFRNSSTDRSAPTDTVSHRYFSMSYSGKKVPLRPRAILRDLKLRPRQLFSQEKYMESAQVLNSMGLFSSAGFTFTPRDTSATCDTLDMTLNCVFDKPYDVSLEADYKIKSNNRTGPGLTAGITKRNVFRGGEKLSLNLRGSYEWQTGHRADGASSTINSYEYGADITLEYPRLEVPFEKLRHRRFYAPPSTKFTVSADMFNRADYFRMMTVGGGVTYKFRSSATSAHEFSPLIVDYSYLFSTTEKFDAVVQETPSLLVSMQSQFIPKMKYTYTYTSPASHRHPIRWETTVAEAGNLLSLVYAAAGKKLDEKNKHLFNNPFAQFLKLNTNLRKTWTLSRKSQLVGRVAAGVIWAFGNSGTAPYNEQFYVGGANSIRAFGVRSIGPGAYLSPVTGFANLECVGDLKLELNLEYRFNITGGLYGALFLDAGNVWAINKEETVGDARFSLSTLLDQLATGTGAGIRYDMDILVLRFDVGVGLHVPYDMGKSGYYNIPKFSRGLGYHFAIGYPF